MTPSRPSYDLIILGTGCAGLSLLMRLARNGWLRDRNVLLVDRKATKENDRTWCFWETGRGFFEEIVYRRWDHLDFYGEGFSKMLDIAPYQYKMIRGIDFYHYCERELAGYPGIERVQANVSGITAVGGRAVIRLDEGEVNAEDAIVLNAIPHFSGTALTLFQHFRGWVIETAQPVFDAGRATLMDFRVSQHPGTAFVYVLPFSARHALVEYTVFSASLLKEEAYESELRAYLHERLQVSDYTISAVEAGVIPMTTERLPFLRNGVFQIGTAGGQTKASSGYTFQFIQKQSQQIADALLSGEPLAKLSSSPARFRFYDNTLLDILYHRKLAGSDIFTRLFKKNKPQRVLRFLDNESSLSEELSLLSTLPVLPFLKAGFRQFF